MTALLIVTGINWLLLLYLIGCIVAANKFKNKKWFWSEEDVMNRRNEVNAKLDIIINKK